MSRYGYTHIHSHTRERTYSQLQNLLHVNAEVHANIKREGKLMSLKAARALSVHRQRTWSRRVSASSAPPPWDGGYDCSLLPKWVTLWNKKMTMTLHRARLQHKKQPVLFIYFYVQATTTDGPPGEVWHCNQLATCRTEDVDVMLLRDPPAQWTMTLNWRNQTSAEKMFRVIGAGRQTSPLAFPPSKAEVRRIYSNANCK